MPGIGGDCYCLVSQPGKPVWGYNGSGRAGAKASYEALRAKGMTEIGDSIHAVTVPGALDAWEAVLKGYGRFGLDRALQPAIKYAEGGFPVAARVAWDWGRYVGKLKAVPGAAKHYLFNGAAPKEGDVIRFPALATTLKTIAAKGARAFYEGEIAEDMAATVAAHGSFLTVEDFAHHRGDAVTPISANYRGLDLLEIPPNGQGLTALVMLNILENFDLKSMGYNSTRYIHTIYQAMSLAFADRDFYYGDPYFSPDEPIQGLLSKDYAKERAKLMNPDKNDPKIGPGDPYPYEGKTNPYRDVMKQRGFVAYNNTPIDENYMDALQRGTTSIEAADKDGWVVSVTPSGGWVPACIAGHTGVGMSQRMQSFVLDPSIDPFNVVEPGKRPRVTLTPSLAMKDGKPFLAFAVQGGDTQDQNLLQFRCI
jgi:gamma-glutamyltranspeptidase/glutathione hydrolase